MPPQLPRHRSALHDAHDLTAELAVDDRPPRDKGNERYLARQDTAIHEVSKIIAPHRSGLASSRRLDDWRLLGGSITGSKERQPQRHLHDAHNLAAELAVDDRPPRDKGELMGFLDHGELAAR